MSANSTQLMSMDELRDAPKCRDTARINPRTGVVTIRGSPKDNGWPRTADIDAVNASRKLQEPSNLTSESEGSVGGLSVQDHHRVADIDTALLCGDLSRRPKTIAQRKAQAMRTLDVLSNLENSPAILTELVTGTKIILQQDWTMLLVYTDYCEYDPENQELFSSRQYARLNIVETLTKVCQAYQSMALRAQCEGYEIDDVAEVRDGWVCLVSELVELEESVDADGASSTSIAEWERGETVSMLDEEDPEFDFERAEDADSDGEGRGEDGEEIDRK